MRHSGLCVPRQFATLAGTAYGHKVSRFFDRLAKRGYATECGCVHNRAALYHVRHQALYRAIGQPESRYRRPVSARLAIDRLMRLEAVITGGDRHWLGSDDEKVAFFRLVAPSHPCERLPHTVVNVPSSSRVKFFPEGLPIGVASTGRVMFVLVMPMSRALVSTEGSHRQFKHPKKPGRVTVSGSLGDDMPKGTLASVKRQTGFKVEKS
jgi:hypothetical protein